MKMKIKNKMNGTKYFLQPPNDRMMITRNKIINFYEIIILKSII